MLVNASAEEPEFRPKRTQKPNFRQKTAHFRAKLDAQMSVNYVFAVGINHARLFASAREAGILAVMKHGSLPTTHPGH